MPSEPSTHVSIPREAALAMAGLLRQYATILEESCGQTSRRRKTRSSRKDNDRARAHAMILAECPGMLPFLPPLASPTRKPRK